MGPAAARCGILLALACTFGSCSRAADVARRFAPVRPRTAAVAARYERRIDGVEYVDLRTVASRLGLAFAWAERGRRAVVSGPGVRAIIAGDTRDIEVNGLRVFLGDPAAVVEGRLYVSRIDAECCLAPLLRPRLAAPVPAIPRTIVLDPGHGGPDEGASNPRLGLKEKVMTLDVGLRLARLLRAQGFRVVMTRTTDRALSPKKDLDLEMRDELANRVHADLFVSIHFNSAPMNTSGTEVYTFAPATQHATSYWSALRKNDPDVENQPQPGNRSNHWSVVLAQDLHRQLLWKLKTEDRGEKIAHWAVLKNLNCPGVLVEPAIITDDAEGRRVAQPWFREEIAQALAAGIHQYAQTIASLHPHPVRRSAMRTRYRPSRFR